METWIVSRKREIGQSLMETVLITTAVCAGVVTLLTALNRIVEKAVSLAIFTISLPAP